MQFEFRLNYNSSKLNTWEMEPLELAGIVKTSRKLDPSGNTLLDTQSKPTAKLKDVTKQNATSTDSKSNSKATSSTKNRRKSSSKKTPVPPIKVKPDTPGINIL